MLTYVDDTTTTLTSSANPSTPGQSVTFTATVAPVRVGGPAPTGTVTFFDGATILGTVALFSGSIATFSTSALTTGSHSITAVFAGDAATAPSTSASLTQVVSLLATETTLTSSSNPSVFGQSVTFTATVENTSGAGGVPTGSVEFFDGATSLGAGSTLSGAGTTATSTFTTSTLTAGGHSISVVYTATGSFLDSTSSILTQTVDQATLTITADDQSKVYGAALPTLTASYSGFVNGDTPASLDTLPTLSDHRHVRQPRRGQPLRHHRRRRRGLELQHQLRGRGLDRHPGVPDDHRRRSGQGLRGGVADADGVVLGLRQRRHPRQPGDPADAHTTATAASHVAGSPYAITADGAAGSDYAINYVAGGLTVTPATLTATADDLSRLRGEANPPLTYTLSGFVNGDGTGVVSGTPTLSTPATINSPDGQYPIDITVGTLGAADYDFTTVDGTLTVVNTSITLSPTTLPVATVGDAYSQQLTASGGSGTGYSFAATGLPAGLSLTTTGLLSGTPATAVGSPFLVDVSVTDGDGGTGSRTYTLSVGKSQAISGDVDASAPQVYFGQEVTLTATFTANSDGQTPMTGTVDFFDGDTYLGTATLVAGPSGLRVASLVSSPLTVPTSGAGPTDDVRPRGRESRHPGRLLRRRQLRRRLLLDPRLGPRPPGDLQRRADRRRLGVFGHPHGQRHGDLARAAGPGRQRPLLRRRDPRRHRPPGRRRRHPGPRRALCRVAQLPRRLRGQCGLGRQRFVGRLHGRGGGGTATTVVGLARFGFHAQPTTLVVSFSGSLDPAVASNRANYVITGPIGGRLRFGRRIAVRSAAYDAASNTVTLTFNRRFSLHKTYRIAIAGSNYVATFGGEILSRATR